MIIKRDEIVGYWQDEGGIICTECAGDDWKDATAEQIITEDELQKAAYNEEEMYCDECGQKLPVLPEKPEKAAPKEMKRRYWVNLGDWNPTGNDEIEAKRIATLERMNAEIGKYEHRTSDPSLRDPVFKTWDKAEAEAALAKAVAIVKEIWGDDPALTDGMDITAQPQCPKCEALARFSSRYCEACGTELVH